MTLLLTIGLGLMPVQEPTRHSGSCAIWEVELHVAAPVEDVFCSGLATALRAAHLLDHATIIVDLASPAPFMSENTERSRKALRDFLWLMVGYAGRRTMMFRYNSVILASAAAGPPDEQGRLTPPRVYVFPEEHPSRRKTVIQ